MQQYQSTDRYNNIKRVTGNNMNIYTSKYELHKEETIGFAGRGGSGVFLQ